jgi:tripartite ATP-independent transporter DctM subunit
VATPTEAAALGALATLIVNIGMGRFNRKMLTASMKGSLEVTSMVLMIVAASKTFSSVLAFTNATDGMVELVTGLEIAPILVIIAMQIIVVILGCLMDPISIMMITIPIFMPIVTALNFDPVWFAVMTMVNLELGNMTPPFGMLIFVMQGVTPKDVTYEDIVWAALPYMLFDIFVIGMIMVWPQIALWLPRTLGE